MAEDKVIERAQKRFNLAADLESEGRIERLDDIKFVRLGQQWPDSVKRDRERPGQERPMLTINRLFQFRNQIINEIRQNRPGIKVRPVDDKSDVDTAEVMQGLIRHIQDASRADIAYDTAAEWQVDCGLGYFRIITDYCEDDSFNQDILIKRVVDPNKVYFDPESTEPDGSDAKWAFVIEDWSLDDFEIEYPDIDTTSWQDGVTGDRQGWFGKDFVRVAEYFEIKSVPRTLVQLQDGSTLFKDELPDEYKDLIIDERPSFDKKCMWYKIGGDKILDKTELPTSFIPVIPVIGEVWCEGKRHVHGLTRFAKDPARQYNYMQSANTEVMALAPRAPYIVAEGQIDGYEQEWLMANRHNISVLTYNPVSFGGTTVGAPQRQQGITTNPGFESAMARAIDDMKSTMGIFDASLGNRESNQSGKAILSQQRQANIGNFHFSDNLNRSIRQAGRIIVEMIPKIYDTQRVIRILGEDEVPKQVSINPEQPEAKMEQPSQQGGVESIYNFNVGKYDIVVDSGPNYATKRQEAAESMMAFVQADPAVLQVAGDLIVRNMDWPGADEIAKRMQAMLPPQIQQTMKAEEDDGQPKVDPQVEQQMNQMADMVEHLTQELQNANAKVGSDEDKLDIERFKAQTDRMKVIADIETKASLTDAQLHQLALANLESTLAMGNTGETEDFDDADEQENEVMPQQPPEMAQQPQQPPIGA